MLSNMLRTSTNRRRVEHSPFSSAYAGEDSSPIAARHQRLEARRQDSGETQSDYEGARENSYFTRQHEVDIDEVDEAEDGDDGDEDGEEAPLLPIFSAAHLGMLIQNNYPCMLSCLADLFLCIDALPVYSLTHTIRLLVTARCETSLTWDQLRSPQVSQFLIKPIQQQIRSSHFGRATLYALLANSLNFRKEGERNPGNIAVSNTRALTCELLAIKLLKEYTTRELIDALSYDFFPLQGFEVAATTDAAAGQQAIKIAAQTPKSAARISALEIAIRAQSKKFLAHPLVVQQLENIWAGNIVFHSAADNLHRRPSKLIASKKRAYGYGAVPRIETNGPNGSPVKADSDNSNVVLRRSVTLYDPREASLFKLSRLRVPRYRSILATGSLAVMLILYMMVLTSKCREITVLEVFFWIWSTGFMLDEIVGFNEQGFSLYMMSLWNSFDLGILILLGIYLFLRLAGCFIASGEQAVIVTDSAYDVLGATAVLLFPRLFSILDHSRYFSQLLVAFRMMASDLMAVTVLILISCSGFFVAFTSFGSDSDNFNASNVAYSLFQLIMGFTPAAWDSWNDYNALGKVLLVLFLFLCHFVIITILITVLTNSFMAIVANANEEHLFLFAVNCISMVKSDALFSYVAPTNVIAWIVTPLRYFTSFTRFVKLNRSVIKITHFPVLFTIFAYERIVLRGASFEPTDLVENRGRPKVRDIVDKLGGGGLFSPRVRIRQGSVITVQKDRVLDEVFRRPFQDSTARGTQRSKLRKTSNVVNSWMQGMASAPSPPPEDDTSVVERLEERKPGLKQSQIIRRRLAARNITDVSRSVASDPEDFLSHVGRTRKDTMSAVGFSDLDLDVPEVRRADGASDDIVRTEEISTEGRDEDMDGDDEIGETEAGNDDETDVFREPSGQETPRLPNRPVTANRARFSSPSSPYLSPLTNYPTSRSHQRTASSATILYNPTSFSEGSETRESTSSLANPKISTPNHTSIHRSAAATATPGGSSGRKTPRRNPPNRSRPAMPKPSEWQSAPNLASLLMSEKNRNTRLMPSGLGRRRPSSVASEPDALAPSFLDQHFGNGLDIPNSFTTQMGYAARTGTQQRRLEGEDLFSRLMLARMSALEEGFREVVQGMREMKSGGDSTRASLDSRDGPAPGLKKGKGKERGGEVGRKAKMPKTKGLKKARPENEEEKRRSLQLLDQDKALEPEDDDEQRKSV
jgi:Ion transport protein